MAIARHHVVTAGKGQEAALRTALIALADAVRPIDGCQGIAMFQTVGSPELEARAGIEPACKDLQSSA